MINTPIILVHGIQGSWLKNQYNVDFQDEIYWDAILKRKTNKIHLNTEYPTFDSSYNKFIFPHQQVPLVSAKILEELQSEASKYSYAFSYDWRKDNRLAAEELSEFVNLVIRKTQIHENDNTIAKVIIVAHSMGGLVVKWYAEQILGEHAKDKIKKIISVATPYKGSIKAIEALIPGARKFFGIDFQKNMRKAARTFPGAYQLLPYYDGAVIDKYTKENIDIFQAKNWQKNVTDKLSCLYGNEFLQTRLDDAKSFLEVVSKPYEGYLKDNFYCIYGEGSRTMSTLFVDRSKSDFFDFKNSPVTVDGDGTVSTRSSITDFIEKNSMVDKPEPIADIIVGQHSKMLNHDNVNDFIVRNILEKEHIIHFESLC